MKYKIRCTDVYYVAREYVSVAINEIIAEYNNRYMYVNYGDSMNVKPKGKKFTVLFVLNKSHNEKKIVVNQFKQ